MFLILRSVHKNFVGKLKIVVKYSEKLKLLLNKFLVSICLVKYRNRTDWDNNLIYLFEVSQTAVEVIFSLQVFEFGTLD